MQIPHREAPDLESNPQSCCCEVTALTTAPPVSSAKKICIYIINFRKKQKLGHLEVHVWEARSSSTFLRQVVDAAVAQRSGVQAQRREGDHGSVLLL